MKWDRREGGRKREGRKGEGEGILSFKFPHLFNPTLTTDNNAETINLL